MNGPSCPSNIRVPIPIHSTIMHCSFPLACHGLPQRWSERMKPYLPSRLPKGWGGERSIYLIQVWIQGSFTSLTSEGRLLPFWLLASECEFAGRQLPLRLQIMQINASYRGE